jgi:hypothetical protein
MRTHRSVTSRQPATDSTSARRWLVAFGIGALLVARSDPAAAQWSTDSTANTIVCAAPFAQYQPTVTSDGRGGVIVTWWDYRVGGDVYAQRINSAGQVRWASNGVLLGAASLHTQPVGIIGDGSGGAIVAWQGFRGATGYGIYAQRVDSTGVVKWTANGVPICIPPGPAPESNPALVSDGSGGAIIAWEDTRSGTSDIYAQRVTAAGSQIGVEQS